MKSKSVNQEQELFTEIQNRIFALLDRKNGTWNGSMSELDQALRTVSRRNLPETWPGAPSVLRKTMNRVVYQLRRSGVSVRFDRETDHFRKRIVSLETR